MGVLAGRGGLMEAERVGDDRCGRLQDELAQRGDAGQVAVSDGPEQESAYAVALVDPVGDVPGDVGLGDVVGVDVVFVQPGQERLGLHELAGHVLLPLNTVAVPAAPLPATISYDAGTGTLHVDQGAFAPVPAEVGL